MAHIGSIIESEFCQRSTHWIAKIDNRRVLLMNGVRKLSQQKYIHKHSGSKSSTGDLGTNKYHLKDMGQTVGRSISDLLSIKTTTSLSSWKSLE